MLALSRLPLINQSVFGPAVNILALKRHNMKNFPSMLAAIGAWLCATGFFGFGIMAFLIGSLYSVIVEEHTGFYTLAFLGANIVGLYNAI